MCIYNKQNLNAGYFEGPVTISRLVFLDALSCGAEGREERSCARGL